jgi:SAM-dependent methyltransferase
MGIVEETLPRKTAMTIDDRRPPDTGSDLDLAIEQFRHPRPVWHGHRLTSPRLFLMRGLSGAVVELGAGNGMKFLLYPPDVDAITVVEPDPAVSDVAREGCLGATQPVRVVTGALTDLPVPDASADVVICSLILCCAERPAESLGEIRRVLKLGGELRFYESVRSPNPFMALTEKLIDPLWSQATGCHPTRDTIRAITKAGFVLDRVTRFEVDRIPHVLGAAHLA